jgi:Raf kinase inhibitor-like YbhB/YbcL family protein
MYELGDRNMTAFEITSTAFPNGGTIPKDFTCSGKNESPPLSWTGAPTTTKSFVLVCEDPDSSSGHFVHWILYNIPFNAVGLPQGIPKKPVTVDGMRHGMNSYGRMEYGGPCPPPGKPHRYVFRLSALDTVLALNAPVTREVLNKAMAGHILGETELMGKFGR